MMCCGCGDPVMHDGFNAQEIGMASEASTTPALLERPDMTLLRSTRPPPPLPLSVFGPAWENWIRAAADAASCPPDYVAGPLLAAASALIGNARWAEATPAWSEPPHLWIGVVGDSGGGKSPGADALMRDVLPVIEQRMGLGFPDQHRTWVAAKGAHDAAMERWASEVKEAGKRGNPPPLPPADAPEEPHCPNLKQHDATIEKMASLLASSAPKGLLMVRDELAGWIAAMNAYNEAGRAFWLESYGGRPYRVARQKHPLPIDIPRLAVAVTGGTQPDKLAQMMMETDDGLLARVCWLWPDPVKFHLGRKAPATEWAIEALDRLRKLDLWLPDGPDLPAAPVMVRMAECGLPDLEAFGQEMQSRQLDASGLMKSAVGKARGTALRLALVLQYLWWCGADEASAAPVTITPEAFKAAAYFVSDYLMPMAARVYGDAAASQEDRNVATLARWMIKTHPAEIYVRMVLREVRLPGLKDAKAVHQAAQALVEGGWLTVPVKGGQNGRSKQAYVVNPAVYERLP